MIEHYVDSLKDFFHDAAGKVREPHVPQVGMSWYIVQERAIAHSYRGYSDGLAHIQIIGIDDEKVELVKNSYYETVPRENWESYYEENLRRARPTKMQGGGSIVPYYKGISYVDPDYAERKRNPFVPRLWY